MSCNRCGNEYGLKLYFCEESDCDICEDCISGQKEYHCNNVDDEGAKCEYTDDCEIYNMKEKENQDIIYVVYLDNSMYNENNRKTAYKLISGAKAVITSDCRKYAHIMFDEAKTGKCWYDIGEEGKQKYIDKAKERFKIKEFVERVK